MPNIYNYEIGSSWQSINTLTNWDVGTNFEIQNMSGFTLFVHISEEEPSADEKGFVLTPYESDLSTYRVDWDAKYDVWVRSISTTIIAVQEI